MTIFTDPTEGNCHWECDATFVGDKPYDNDDGTNPPGLGDGDIVYALLSGSYSSFGSLVAGLPGERYNGFSDDYPVDVKASVTSISNPNNPSVTSTSNFGSQDPGNYRLFITEPTYFCKNILYTDGSWAANYLGRNPFDYSIYKDEYPELANHSDTIIQNGFFGGNRNGGHIWYGKWKTIRGRVRQYNIETGLYVNQTVDSEGNESFAYPWEVPDDLDPHSYYPLIIWSVYRPSDGYTTPLKPNTYADACKWKCENYQLPGQDKTQAWGITDADTYRIKDQYNRQVTLTPCASPDGECENIRLVGIDAYFGGEECECPEDTIECKGRNGRKCCLKCCDLGAYVLNLFEGATQNANFDG